MVENISSKEVIVKIIGWKKIFILITLITAAISVILLLMMPKQYLSTTVLFPTRNFSVSKLVVENNAGNQEDYMVLGYMDDCERLLQALNTDRLKLEVADHLDLWTSWKLKDKGYKFHHLKKKWQQMVTVKRTDYNSVKIEVYDYTANGAAHIANAIAQFADTIKFHMNKRIADGVVDIVKEEHDATMARIGELEDTLASLRRIGVMHYKEMTKALMKKYAAAIQEGDQAAAARLDAKLAFLRKHGSAYQYAKDNLDMYSAKYPDIRMKYDEALVNAENQLPMKFIVEAAIPNEFKAKPKRFLLLLIAVLAANFVTLFVLLIYDRWKNGGRSAQKGGIEALLGT